MNEQFRANRLQLADNGWLGLLAWIGRDAAISAGGMWALPCMLPTSARARERALFRNEIAHARVKLDRREKALARATIAARTVKIVSRESRLDRMKASLARTQADQAKREAEKAEKARVARDKELRLRAQKLAMNGASVSGTRTAADNLYRSTYRK